MANHKSAKTRIKRNNKRAAFAVAESELMRAAQKGVVEKHNASRTVSRLSKKIKAL